MKMIRFLQRRHAFFERRHIFWIAALLAVLVSLPSLTSGFFVDDYQQRTILLQGSHDNPFEFFRRGTPRTEAMVQNGVVPWWFYPDSKVSFYRPITQWLMGLDYRLWPDNPVLMHLQSVFWYGLLALVTGLTYRQLMPTRWAAGFAAVLFAIDAGHGGAVAWLCNRAWLLAFLGSMLALLCYRRDELRWHILGCALFVIALACGEPALAISGYFFAYELCLSDRPLSKRVLRLLPYAVVAVGWLAYWKMQGHGTSGPGVYADPLADPTVYLKEMIYRMPANLVGQFFLPPADMFSMVSTTPPLRAFGLVYAWSSVAVLAWILTPLLRASRLARFYGVGILLSLVLLCGSTPVGRSLWFVGFGAIGLIALYIEQFRTLSMPSRSMRIGEAFATIMVVLHLWLSPLLYIGNTKMVDFLDTLNDTRLLHLPDDGPPGKKILVVSTLTYYGQIEYPLLKDEALSLGRKPSRPPPSITHVRGLSEGSGEFVLTRKDADTLLVETPTRIETLLRSGVYGFAVGDKVVLDDVEIEVLAVSPSKEARVVEYRFKPGVLATYEPIAWQHTQFEPMTLPAIGERTVIKTEYGIPGF